MTLATYTCAACLPDCSELCGCNANGSTAWRSKEITCPRYVPAKIAGGNGLRRVLGVAAVRQWFSGKIFASHAKAPVSITGCRIVFLTR